MFFWKHTRFGCLKTCKLYAGPYYRQFMILMHAILLYEQFMTFMQPYVTIYDLVFISCILYGGQPASPWSYHIIAWSLCSTMVFNPGTAAFIEPIRITSWISSLLEYNTQSPTVKFKIAGTPTEERFTCWVNQIMKQPLRDGWADWLQDGSSVTLSFCNVWSRNRSRTRTVTARLEYPHPSTQAVPGTQTHATLSETTWALIGISNKQLLL